jgi:hypothetical protein
MTSKQNNKYFLIDSFMSYSPPEGAKLTDIDYIVISILELSRNIQRFNEVCFIFVDGGEDIVLCYDQVATIIVLIANVV